jgi:hypothetical protein
VVEEWAATRKRSNAKVNVRRIGAGFGSYPLDEATKSSDSTELILYIVFSPNEPMLPKFWDANGRSLKMPAR